MKTASPARLLVTGIAAAALLSACGDSPGAPAAANASAHPVTIKAYAFAPADVTVAAGTVVAWTNQDQTIHTVTSAPGAAAVFDSGNLDTGGSFSHTFATPGRYPYHCSIHSNMMGTLTVQ